MSTWSLLLLAVGLAMDAFAVSVCKGLAAGRTGLRGALLCGAWFGGFQALMPALGCLLGAGLERYIAPVDHWVAFALLGAIGANMLREAVRGGEPAPENASFAFRPMLTLALATSVDALTVGITFAVLEVDLLAAVLLIGLVTFLVSAAGVLVGGVFGARFKGPAELFGGGVLILLGAKILLEHLGVL